MAVFKDKSGREWLLSLNLLQLERIQERVGVRIDRLLDNQCAGLFELFGDLIAFGKVLWVLVERQAEAAKITPEQFAENVWGDPIEAACNAFIEALADFSPSRQRKALQALSAKIKQVEKASEMKLDRLLAEFMEQNPEEVSELLEKTRAEKTTPPPADPDASASSKPATSSAG